MISQIIWPTSLYNTQTNITEFEVAKSFRKIFFSKSKKNLSKKYFGEFTEVILGI